MTRRASQRPGKVLSLNAYVHRATLGLPGAARLDAAAELRAHLLERVEELEGKGFARDEAEFLAVRAMGDPSPTNRSLLGHALTWRLGWAVLGLVLLGAGGWWSYDNLMPPAEGVSYQGSELSLDDLRTLNTDTDAPRGNYQTATLTYPKETKTVYYLYFTPSNFALTLKDVSEENSTNIVGRWPGSYRYQERLLVTDQPRSTDCPQDWNLFSSVRVLPSRFWNGPYLTIRSPSFRLDHTAEGKELCSGLKRRYRQEAFLVPVPGKKTFQVELLPPAQGIMTKGRTALALNHWTILRQLGLNPRKALNGDASLKGKASGLYIAVLPSDQPASSDESGLR
ncbi:permease prefix domain 1-containing protein [Deinococcus irradiatisoli]|uniref:permease prefix domain 1-containing protein n=1 Tax=Deinococcus irradiatisoli TaxID=2202254 RepID=UPI0015E8681B|nr:permease prefix domain 1-containing protein [Deinococcus irradiatisoli]